MCANFAQRAGFGGTSESPKQKESFVRTSWRLLVVKDFSWFKPPPFSFKKNVAAKQSLKMHFRDRRDAAGCEP